jgi:hypothetical protein
MYKMVRVAPPFAGLLNTGLWINLPFQSVLLLLLPAVETGLTSHGVRRIKRDCALLSLSFPVITFFTPGAIWPLFQSH